MHSGDLTELGAAKLTDTERDALLEVMHRAKEFDSQNASKSIWPGSLEGLLYKWTNPLKGWQPRWFYVDQQQGVLHYYTSEERRKHPPRGSLHLWGAVIAPSEDDSQSFAVNSANGEIFKLRAVDAKERQYWVSRLRREVENCNNQGFGTTVKEALKISGSTTPSQPSPSSHHTDKPDGNPTTGTQMSTPTRSLSKRLPSLSLSRSKLRKKSRIQSRAGLQEPDDVSQLPGGDAMLGVLMRLQCYQDNLVAQLESTSEPAGLNPTDKNVLLLKATSLAAVSSVKDCLAVMKQQQQQQLQSPPHSQSSQSSHTSQHSTSALPHISPPSEAGVGKRTTEIGESLDQPLLPLSTPNLEEQLIDLSPAPRTRTESMERRTHKRYLSATTV